MRESQYLQLLGYSSAQTAKLNYLQLQVEKNLSIWQDQLTSFDQQLVELKQQTTNLTSCEDPTHKDTLALLYKTNRDLKVIEKNLKISIEQPVSNQHNILSVIKKSHTQHIEPSLTEEQTEFDLSTVQQQSEENLKTIENLSTNFSGLFNNIEDIKNDIKQITHQLQHLKIPKQLASTAYQVDHLSKKMSELNGYLSQNTDAFVYNFLPLQTALTSFQSQAEAFDQLIESNKAENSNVVQLVS